MNNQWRREGEPRIVKQHDSFIYGGGEVTLQYLRGPGGVGAHEVLVSSEYMLTMLPDATTTPRKRTGAVSVALGEDHSLLAAIVGELVLAGATNLLLNGKPLIERERTGRWIVEMFKDGEVDMRYVAEVEEGATSDAGEA